MPAGAALAFLEAAVLKAAGGRAEIAKSKKSCIMSGEESRPAWHLPWHLPRLEPNGRQAGQTKPALIKQPEFPLMPPAENKDSKRAAQKPEAQGAEEQGSLAEIKAHLADFLKDHLYSGAEKKNAPSDKAQSPLPPSNGIPLKSLLEQPRAGAFGHLALPVFRLPRPPGESPQSLAKAFEKKITSSSGLPHFLKSARAEGGFVNFIFTENFLSSRLARLLSKKKLGFFEGARPAKHYVMDFASPNVAKRINAGHLRAAAQGQALVNLARRFGCHVTALNHLGDWGSQVGKLLWAWKAWGHEYDFEKEPFESLASLYTRFYREAESDPEKLKQAVSLFQKLEAGDPDLKKIWRRFADLSLEDYGRYWKILNIRHDKVIGESFYTDFLSGLKSRLRAKGLLKKSDGAEVVFLKSGPPCLVTKSDGASTYGARDLCSAIYRFEKLGADQLIYIAGSDQKLHFRQIFEVLEKLSPAWRGRSLHLSFGMYRFKGLGKMSSRRGQAVYLKDLLSQAAERVEKIISARPAEGRADQAKIKRIKKQRGQARGKSRSRWELAR